MEVHRTIKSMSIIHNKIYGLRETHRQSHNYIIEKSGSKSVIKEVRNGEFMSQQQVCKG
jgi:hypothetical protein